MQNLRHFQWPLLILICLAACVALLQRPRKRPASTAYQDYERSASAFVILSKGVLPFVAHVRVLNPAGDAAAGAEIDIRNNAGGNHAITDELGKAVINLAEYDVQEILLDNVSVFSRPNSYFNGFPHVKEGLQVLIIKRDPIKGF